MLVVIGSFSGLTMFYLTAIGHSVDGVDESMNTSYAGMNETLTEMMILSQTIQNDTLDIKELSGIEVVITSITGFTNVINLFKAMIDMGAELVDYLFFSASGLSIPAWATTIVLIGSIIFVVVAILKAVSGRTTI